MRKKKSSQISQSSNIVDGDILNTENANDLIYQNDSTICKICQGGDDEDLVLVCDGDQCKHEVHMYCLNPPLSKVPEGNWYCPECDEYSEVEKLKAFLSKYSQFKNNVINTSSAQSVRKNINTSVYSSDNAVDNSCDIKDYNLDAKIHDEELKLLQLNRIPLNQWKCERSLVFLKSEFDSSSTLLIGCLITIKDHDNSNIFTGRIINRRRCIEYDRKFEHLIQFKSNSDNRNHNYMIWVCLDEIPCSVGAEVVWARVTGFPFWPALKSLHSGLDLLESAIKDSEISSQSIYDLCEEYNDTKIYLYFFGEETTTVMTLKEAESSVVSFEKRGRHFKSSMKHKLSVALSLANLEREEMLSARRSFKLMDEKLMETTGALVDGILLKDFEFMINQNTHIQKKDSNITSAIRIYDSVKRHEEKIYSDSKDQESLNQVNENSLTIPLPDLVFDKDASCTLNNGSLAVDSVLLAYECGINFKSFNEKKITKHVLISKSAKSSNSLLIEEVHALEFQRKLKEQYEIVKQKQDELKTAKYLERLHKKKLKLQEELQKQLEIELEDKLRMEMEEKERLEKERLEKERLEKEILEKERLEKERLEAERLELERLENERIEKERIEFEKLEKERLEKERIELEKSSQIKTVINDQDLSKKNSQLKKSHQKRKKVASMGDFIDPEDLGMFDDSETLKKSPMNNKVVVPDLSFHPSDKDFVLSSAMISIHDEINDLELYKHFIPDGIDSNDTLDLRQLASKKSESLLATKSLSDIPKSLWADLIVFSKKNNLIGRLYHYSKQNIQIKTLQKGIIITSLNDLFVLEETSDLYKEFVNVEKWLNEDKNISIIEPKVSTIPVNDLRLERDKKKQRLKSSLFVPNHKADISITTGSSIKHRFNKIPKPIRDEKLDSVQKVKMIKLDNGEELEVIDNRDDESDNNDTSLVTTITPTSTEVDITQVQKSLSSKISEYLKSIKAPSAIETLVKIPVPVESEKSSIKYDQTMSSYPEIPIHFPNFVADPITLNNQQDQSNNSLAAIQSRSLPFYGETSVDPNTIYNESYAYESRMHSQEETKITQQPSSMPTLINEERSYQQPIPLPDSSYRAEFPLPERFPQAYFNDTYLPVSYLPKVSKLQLQSLSQDQKSFIIQFLLQTCDDHLRIKHQSNISSALLNSILEDIKIMMSLLISSKPLIAALRERRAALKEAVTEKLSWESTQLENNGSSQSFEMNYQPPMNLVSHEEFPMHVEYSYPNNIPEALQHQQTLVQPLEFDTSNTHSHDMEDGEEAEIPLTTPIDDNQGIQSMNAAAHGNLSYQPTTFPMSSNMFQPQDNYIQERSQQSQNQYFTSNNHIQPELPQQPQYSYPDLYSQSIHEPQMMQSFPLPISTPFIDTSHTNTKDRIIQNAFNLPDHITVPYPNDLLIHQQFSSNAPQISLDYPQEQTFAHFHTPQLYSQPMQQFESQQYHHEYQSKAYQSFPPPPPQHQQYSQIPLQSSATSLQHPFQPHHQRSNHNHNQGSYRGRGNGRKSHFHSTGYNNNIPRQFH